MSLRDLIGKIEETYGAGTVAQGSRGNAFRLSRFTTTVFELDAAIGGGIPRRRFIQFYGPPSGGKSLMSDKSIAGIQLYCRYCLAMFMPDLSTGELRCDCPVVCPGCDKPYEKSAYKGPEPKDGDPFNWAVIHDEWTCECLVAGETKKKADRIPLITRRASRCRAAKFDTEHGHTLDFSTAMGVNNDLLFVFQPEYAEQGIDIADTLLRSTEIDALVIDSIAEMTPGKEIEGSAEDWQMGLHARLVNKAIRRWGASINSMGINGALCPTVIMVNQTRQNMDGEEVTPGGHGQNFKASIRVRVNAAQYEIKEEGKGEEKTRELQYASISGFTKKNKTFPPQQRFKARVYLNDHDGHPKGSTNEESVVFDHALEQGVIGEGKNTYTFTSEITTKSHSWTTQKACKEAMMADPVLFWEIRNAALDRVLKGLA